MASREGGGVKTQGPKNGDLPLVLLETNPQEGFKGGTLQKTHTEIVHYVRFKRCPRRLPFATIPTALDAARAFPVSTLVRIAARRDDS